EVAALLHQHLAQLQQGPNIVRPTRERKPPSVWTWWRFWLWPSLAVGLLVGFNFWFNPSQARRSADPQQDKTGRSGITSDGTRPEVAENRRNVANVKPAVKPDVLDGAQAGDRKVLTDLRIAFHWCPPGCFIMTIPKNEIRQDDLPPDPIAM